MRAEPGDTLDVLDNGRLRIAVRRTGAEMTSLRARTADGGWVGFLHRDGEISQPAQGWANHATVMGYYVHRLLGGRSIYRGREIRGGTHGFLRHKVFDAPAVTTTTLTYRVGAAEIPPDAYPLPVEMRLHYTLAGGSLRVDFEFQNLSEETAHLSFGLHPGFAVSSTADFRIEFAPGIYTRFLAPGNFLDGRTQTIEHGGGPFTLDRAALPDTFLFGLAGVPEPIFRLRDGDRCVELDFRGVPFVAIWSDGGPFVCVEPCWGLPDSNPQKPFESKDGIQTIAPRGLLRAGFSITPATP